MNTLYRLITLFFIIVNAGLYSQDFSVYEQLIDAGKITEVQKSLNYLKTQYPDHPFVRYLEASTNTNGDQALQRYRSIVAEYPGTRACELSVMKIGEYLYSKGLYTQASEQLKIIPISYPQSGNIERAVDLIKKSLLAIGEQDSVDYYIKRFSKKYPKLNFNDYDYYSAVIMQADKSSNERTSEDVVKPEQIKSGKKPWVVQVGAFKERGNADTIVNRLKSAGYRVEVVENEDKLFLVQIVSYATIEEAVNVGEKINDQFGIEFRVIERN